MIIRMEHEQATVIFKLF